jgi:hypothetical protein
MTGKLEHAISDAQQDDMDGSAEQCDRACFDPRRRSLARCAFFDSTRVGAPG